MKIGEVTPKLPSTKSLFQTLLVLPMAGKAPVSVAVPLGHFAVAGHPGGRVWPIVTVVASPVYTLLETNKLPGISATESAHMGEAIAPASPANRAVRCAAALIFDDLFITSKLTT